MCDQVARTPPLSLGKHDLFTLLIDQAQVNSRAVIGANARRTFTDKWKSEVRTQNPALVHTQMFLCVLIEMNRFVS